MAVATSAGWGTRVDLFQSQPEEAVRVLPIGRLSLRGLGQAVIERSQPCFRSRKASRPQPARTGRLPGSGPILVITMADPGDHARPIPVITTDRNANPERSPDETRASWCRRPASIPCRPVRERLAQACLLGYTAGSAFVEDAANRVASSRVKTAPFAYVVGGASPSPATGEP